MKLHLLLTSDIALTMPKTCKIILDYGDLDVVFEDETKTTGKHCVVEDTAENIREWLKPFDGFVAGNGIPQFEQFHIAHIN